MFLTGFADEASHDLKEQIRATEELGWKFIETRAIGEKNLGTLSDAAVLARTLDGFRESVPEAVISSSEAEISGAVR